MDRARLTLDNPAFTGRLRSYHRSPAYVKRPIQYSSTKVIQDVRPSTYGMATLPSKPKLTPRHVIKPAASLHARPKASPGVRASAQSSPAYRPTEKRQKLTKQTLLLYAMAAVVFVAGIAVTINGFRTNRQVVAQVNHVSSNQSSSNGAAAPGVPPSTKKISPAAVRNYVVAPNLPRYIDIPALGVHARVLSLGVDKNDALETPWNVYDTGWYNASAQPGQNGAMLVDGHSGVGIQHGVFHDLPELKKGENVVITRGDGQKFTYKVVSVQVVPVKRVDMASMLVSADTSKPGLNLITCAGDRVPGTTDLTDRVLVKAVL